MLCAGLRTKSASERSTISWGLSTLFTQASNRRRARFTLGPGEGQQTSMKPRVPEFPVQPVRREKKYNHKKTERKRERQTRKPSSTDTGATQPSSTVCVRTSIVPVCRDRASRSYRRRSRATQTVPELFRHSHHLASAPRRP